VVLVAVMVLVLRIPVLELKSSHADRIDFVVVDSGKVFDFSVVIVVVGIASLSFDTQSQKLFYEVSNDFD
jgi:hypothetical protein